MLGVAVGFLMLFILQIVRYDLFHGKMTAQRYAWYAMYIPMTAQPILCFFLAIFIHRPQDAPPPRRYFLILVPALLLVLGILTNDLHFGFVSFPSGILDDNGQEVRGWLLYVFYAFTYGLYALAYFVILRKDFRFAARKDRWLPLIPLLILVIYMTLYPFRLDYIFLSTRVWQLGEIQFFCLIATLEACIQTGMIPANHGYEKLFYCADLPAVILDGAGIPIYKTNIAQYPFAESKDKKTVSHPIHGGSIEYLVDIKQINWLNQQIEEAMQQIETRNAYVSQETNIKQERAELETRNRLYERVSGIVRPQLEQIEILLSNPEDCGEKELARIAVMQTYIKRRSNMELLSAAGTLSVVELASAVAESLDYVRLCGANTATSFVGVDSFPADMVIAAYEQIEEITEESLDTLSDMIVTIRSDQLRLIVRMMLKADSFSYNTKEPPQNTVFSRKVSITKEDQDLIIVLTFTEGGGQQ